MCTNGVFATIGAIVILSGLLVLGPKIAPRVTSAEEQATPSPTPGSPTPKPASPSPTPFAIRQNDPPRRSMFHDNLPKKFELPTDETGDLLLHEYGAVFVARNGVVPPKKVVFRDEKDVSTFHDSVETAGRTFGSVQIKLQKAAMDDLSDAVAQAQKNGLSISPRGADSGSRDYEQTRRLWASRVNPGMKYWVAKGRVSSEEAARIQAMPAFDQVTEILRLERSGIWFAKSLDKSIIYSVAPPGTSQHLAMLAFDVAEFDNPRVRSILAEHGWFQTVVSDLPHFTYLGVEEKALPGLGLKQKSDNTGRTFWVPDL